MSKMILNYEIERVRIIDDEEQTRAALELHVDEWELVAIQQTESVFSIESFFDATIKKGDAIVTDHHLRKRNYFPINGAQVTAMCYDKAIPTVLVTRYETSDMHEIRQYRDRIPVILKPDEVDSGSLERAFEVFLREMNGEKSAERKAWRTQVIVDDVVDNHFYVVVPGWNPNETVYLSRNNLPEGAFEKLRSDMILYAHVNTGAASINDLYFINWEI
jgi:hypothetical protein